MGLDSNSLYAKLAQFLHDVVGINYIGKIFKFASMYWTTHLLAQEFLDEGKIVA